MENKATNRATNKTTNKSTDKRQQLINTALQLFYQRGIHAVGINEVLAQSGIAKKTLYNHFASKEELIQACITERDQCFMAWLTTRCINNHSAIIFVERVFDALHDWINETAAGLGSFNGCFFINAAAEYADTNNKIYQLCSLHKLHVKAFFQQELSLLIDNEQHVNLLIELLLLLKEGSINCAHVMGDKQSALKAKKLALTFLNSQSN